MKTDYKLIELLKEFPKIDPEDSDSPTTDHDQLIFIYRTEYTLKPGKQ